MSHGFNRHRLASLLLRNENSNGTRGFWNRVSLSGKDSGVIKGETGKLSKESWNVDVLELIN